MKKIFLLILIFLSTLTYSQVGINTVNPNQSSTLDIVSSTKGLLIPRMSSVARLNIQSPANGLMVYDLTDSRIYIYNAALQQWKKILTDEDLVNFTQNLKYDIFLIAGQSNTHYGKGLSPTLDASDPDIFQVGRFNGFDSTIIPASEPLHHWTWQTNRIGFALTFAKQYKQNLLQPGRKVLLIPCGYASTTIEQWGKGGTLYNDAVRRTINALIHNPGSQIKGILWHQGESSVGNPNYTTLLDQFLTDIRNDLGDANLPIVLGGMVPYWVNGYAGAIPQQDIIKNTPNRVIKTAYADPTIPTTIVKPDNVSDIVHYDADGQRELGLRYYKAFFTLTH